MKPDNIFKKSRKNNFGDRKIEKIECTDIINTFPQHVAKVSEWPTHRQARQLVHIFDKIFLNGFIGWTRSWGTGSQMMSQIMDLLGFPENRQCSSVPSTPRTKNYAANEVSRPKSFPRKKKFFLRKSFFRNIFGIFQLVKIQKFAIWPIRGCVRT